MHPALQRGTRDDLAEWLRKWRRALKLRIYDRYDWDGLPTHIYAAKRPTFDHPDIKRKTLFMDFQITPF